jgi:hypothetical protein
MVMSTREQPTPSWGEVIGTAVRILTFTATREDLLQLGLRHLTFGLICSLIVGIGRYYDNDRVGLLQHLGIGSVVYVLLLSLFLWLLIWPLGPKDWSYIRVAAFVSLVSPPSILYAIPIEYFSSVEVANTWSAVFLGIIATWRLALLIFFLRRLARLQWSKAVVATLLPLCIIVVTIAWLNPERVVFNLMGDVTQQSANDTAYFFLVGLSYLAMIMFLPLFIAYVVMVVQSVSARRRPSHWPEWMDE